MDDFNVFWCPSPSVFSPEQHTLSHRIIRRDKDGVPKAKKRVTFPDDDMLVCIREIPRREDAQSPLSEELEPCDPEKLAKEVVLMVDSSKLNTCSEYFFAELKDITHIITDNGASAESVAALRSHGCKVTLAQ